MNRSERAPRPRLPILWTLASTTVAALLVASTATTLSVRNLVAEDVSVLDEQILEQTTALNRVIFAVSELLTTVAKTESDSFDAVDLRSRVTEVEGHMSVVRSVDERTIARIAEGDPLLLAARIPQAEAELQRAVTTLKAVLTDSSGEGGNNARRKQLFTAAGERLRDALRDLDFLYGQLASTYAANVRSRSSRLLTRTVAMTVINGVLLVFIVGLGAVYYTKLRDTIGELGVHRDRLLELVDEKTADLRSALDDREMLLREIHHRVKNNLSMIDSILNLQASESAEAAKPLSEVKERIRAIGLIHEKLYQGADLSAVELAPYFTDLVEFVTQTMTHSPIETSVSVSDEHATLDPDTLLPLALIATELLTNAIKYGVTADNRRIELTVEIDNTGGTLSVANSGRPLPAEFAPSTDRSLGYTLIFALAEQVGGHVVVEREPLTKVTVDFLRSE